MKRSGVVERQEEEESAGGAGHCLIPTKVPTNPVRSTCTTSPSCRPDGGVTVTAGSSTG
jgi:hypothetical protein